jgi:hypothetical protein
MRAVDFRSSDAGQNRPACGIRMAQEGKKLLLPAPRLALCEDLAVGNVERKLAAR